VAVTVAILEDNADRIDEMQACLSEALPDVLSVFFENAFEMIAWLKEHLGEVVLISLDHDLPLLDGEGRPSDCGDGRMVADFLASRPPTCPVIVHSSNAYCAPGMCYALEEAHWLLARVVPYEEHAWVRSAWKPQIDKWVKDGWITPSSGND
jgi:hypothetical protein